MNENEEIVLRTYGSVWNIERKIYSIDGLKLLVPIAINELAYFALSIVVTFILVKFLPFFNNLHFVIKFLAVPFILMKFFTSIKLDGKLPHKFMWDYCVYIITPKYYCRFQPVEQYKKIRFTSPVLFRRYSVVNKTDEVIKKEV
ncbi:TcpE family conjugal transfer membrane protein [Clostridium hydrogeniformans]|uniref:TcpE family conjugal transfer membrane protein n=1 Tax=Clostridium hydrogeniformans TaxID=349933 RepID=UPI00068D2182|nr:TcpE family conjugal transfer membrane protein [Clostridium hydrogeniformans]